ncbi:MAG TPA: alpha/beta hydrolase [Terriglobales bacterium]|nr:alpha/beta hydrolase [Terriglobales bacterium]
MRKPIWIVVFLTAVCAAAANDPAPIGRLVDIGGRKLNIHCTGAGTPTVIVENGGAAFSFDWALVQPQVSRFTRICTYDRAGYAWSDVGPEFDSFNQADHDLYLLLTKAGVPGPFVLVGHSFGGLLVRFYQARHPANVVGMVLVDSSHEESPQHVGLKVVRIPELTANQFKALIDGAKAKRPNNPEPDLVPTTIYPPYDKLPAQLQNIHLWALRKVLPLVKSWGLNLQFDLSRLHEMRLRSPHPLGTMPLAVLTATEFDVTAAPGMTSEQAKQDHLRLQNDLAQLSTNSQHVMVPDSSHEIYLYQPAIVIRSISAVVNAARKHSRLKTIE